MANGTDGKCVNLYFLTLAISVEPSFCAPHSGSKHALTDINYKEAPTRPTQHTV